MALPNRSMTHIDRALTTMSVAYIQDRQAFISDKMFPIVRVQQQSDRYFMYLKEDWFRDEAKERTRATESAGGGYRIDNTPTYYCRRYAYHMDVTEEDRVNSDEPLNADTDAAEFTVEKMLLHREALWANTYFKTNVWGTEYAGVNAAPNASQVLQWNDASSTPIEDIEAAKIEMVRTTGQMPNKLLLGLEAYSALKNHPDMLERIKYTQRGVMTTDLLATLLDVPQVLVGYAIKNAAVIGATESTDFILGKHALLCHAAPRPALKQPSAGYTFAWTGYMGASAYGHRMVRIPMEWLGIGTERIECEMAFDQKVVCSDLGVFFNGVVA